MLPNLYARRLDAVQFLKFRQNSRHLILIPLLLASKVKPKKRGAVKNIRPAP